MAACYTYILLLMMTITVTIDTVSSRCPSTYTTCTCGGNGESIYVEIKRCLSMDDWGPVCKPCKRHIKSKVCQKFKKCLQCAPGVNGGCAKCEIGLYGRYCTNECKCLNSGDCDTLTGRCDCKESFSGTNCEIKSLKDCGFPNNPVIGKILAPETSEGSIAKYTCPDNFYLIGHEKRTCLSSGQWSGRTPICEYSCPVPVVTRHLQVKTEPVPHISDSYISNIELIRSASFECEEGYKLIGEKVLACLPNGRWNAEQPICVLACEPPEPIKDGEMVINDSRFLQGDEVHFRCHTNFRLEVNSSIFCLNGTWSLPYPTCVPNIMCRRLELEMTGGHVQYSSEDRISGTEAQIKCFDGFERKGSYSRICKYDGKWSGDDTECIEVEDGPSCPDPEEPENGFFNYDVESQYMIYYKCNQKQGYYISGVEENICYDGRWQYNTPMCTKMITCQEIETPIGCRRCFGSGCSLSGLPSVDCMVAIGDTKLPPGLYPAGTIIEFKFDRQFYTLEGSKRRTCQTNGFWSGRQPVCIAKCGIPTMPRRVNAKIRGGKSVPHGQWPWQVAIIWKDSHGNLTFRCGGSLISEDWILTAAHCVNVTREYMVQVRLGQTNLLEEHDPDVMVIENVSPSNIIVHEKYDQQSQDFDIARIKLDSKVTFSTVIKPVCLPDVHRNEDNRSYYTRLNPKLSNITGVEGVVIGWGYTEMKKHSNILHMANVTIIGQETCVEFYKDQNINITDNMLCAGGTGPDQQDACSGDSGGPLLIKDDNGRWTIVGIVNSGSNCTVPSEKRYGVYTRVDKFIKWIQKDL